MSGLPGPTLATIHATWNRHRARFSKGRSRRAKLHGFGDDPLAIAAGCATLRTMARTLLAELKADPWTVARVDASLARYAHMMTPVQLAWAREQMFEQLANDEHALRTLRRAHPREGDESGDVGWPALGDEDTPAVRKRSEAG